MRKRWIFLTIALIALTGCAFALWASSRTTDGLRQVLAARREAGEPLTFAEIQAQRTPITGKGETVADIVSRIAQAVVASPYTDSRGLFGDGDFFDGIERGAVEPSRKYMDAKRPAIQGLDAIADLEPGRFRISYRDEPLTAYNMQSPNFGRILQLLSLDAKLRLVDREIEAAASYIPLFFRVVSPLSDEPNMVAQMKRETTARRAATMLESILRAGKLSNETLELLDEEFRSFLASYTMKWSLWGERACLLALHDDKFGMRGLQRAVLSVSLTGDKRKSLEFIHSLIDAQDNPARLLSAAKTIESELAKLPKRYLFASFMATSIPRRVRSHVECLAEIRAVRVLNALERFRLRTGTLPTALDELVPTYVAAIPTDPFDQAPLKFTTRDRMLIVYSVGSDGVDDGGQVAPVGGEKRARDRGFRLLPVADRGVVFSDETKASNEQ